MTYTYNSLRDDIVANMEEDSSEFFAALPTIISRAQQYLQKRMDAAQINRFVTVSCSAGNRECALPTDLLVLKAAQVEVSGATENLLPQTNEYLTAYWPAYTSLATPKYYANKDTTAIFLAPTPVSSFPITLEYVARITVLSSANQTNWFSENAENAFFAAGMMQANLWTKNSSSSAIWKSIADEELAAANNEFRRSRRSDIADRTQGAPENNIAEGST